MKVFFSASPRALKNYENNFLKIYSIIEKLGHQHLSKLVVENDINHFYSYDEVDREKYFLKTMSNIQSSDVVIVEASIHSLAIGYIVEKALELSKQVIVLYTQNNEPFFFSGNTNERLQLIEYSLENISMLLKEAIDYAYNGQDVRFNMIFTNKMNNFVKKTAKSQNISKASYIRSLIYKEMTK